MEKLGKYLRLIREERRISLRKLGERIGVSHNRLGKFERGEEKPTSEMIQKIEKGLGISITECKEVDDEINLLLEEFLEAQFNNQKVIDDYEEVIKLNRVRYENSLVFAKIILLEYIIDIIQGDLESAEKKEKMIENSLTDMFAKQAYLQYKGVYCFFKKDYKEAIHYLTSAQNILYDEKRLAMIAYHLTMVYKDVHQITLAIINLKVAKKIFSKNSSYRRAVLSDIELAGAYGIINLTDEAIAIYKAVLKAADYLDIGEEGKRKAVRNLSWTCLRAGRYAECIENLNSELTAAAIHPLAVLYGIWCNLKLKHYKEAERLISEHRALMAESSFRDEFEFVTSLVYLRNGTANKQLLDQAIRLFEKLQNNVDAGTVLFYLDCIIDMLKARKNESELVKYMDIKISLMSAPNIMVI